MEIRTYEDWVKTNPEVAERILDKNRDINTDYDWHEFTIEEFCEDIKKYGFYVNTEDVNFSGFYSQGDGASFTGYVDILEYLKHEKKLSKFRNSVRTIRNDKVQENLDIIRNSSFYVHENTCEVDYIEIYEDTTDIVQDELSDIEKEIENTRYELCLYLYKILEESYNNAISDKSVAETLIANEYEFDEEGDMF